jgi:PIN domain nuclease of toxin-antitoxin system
VNSVLDASALLAFLLRERGSSDVLNAILRGTCLTAVNLCEVASVYARRGLSQQGLKARMGQLPFPIIEISAGLAYDAASLLPATSKAGLSIGDRCCLALGIQLGVPAVTADLA